MAPLAGSPSLWRGSREVGSTAQIPDLAEGASTDTVLAGWQRTCFSPAFRLALSVEYSDATIETVQAKTPKAYLGTSSSVFVRAVTRAPLFESRVAEGWRAPFCKSHLYSTGFVSALGSSPCSHSDPQEPMEDSSSCSTTSLG